MALAAAAPAMAASTANPFPTAWTWHAFSYDSTLNADGTCNASSAITYTVDSTSDAGVYHYVDGVYIIEESGKTGSSVVTGLYSTYTFPTSGLTFTIDDALSTDGWVSQGEIGQVTYNGQTYYQYRFYLAGPVTLPWTNWENGGTVTSGSTGIYLKATSNTVTWCNSAYRCTPPGGGWGYSSGRVYALTSDGSSYSWNDGFSCMPPTP